MSTKSTTQLLIRYPQEWHARLLELCRARGIDPDPPRGRAGGISMLARQLLAEAIGEEAKDLHQEQSNQFIKARIFKMLNPTRITVTTSTDGLAGVPADLYSETAEEMIGRWFDGAEVDVEVSDRHLDTKIEIEPGETPDYTAHKAYEEAVEQIGRLLQEAFDVACSRV